MAVDLTRFASTNTDPGQRVNPGATDLTRFSGTTPGETVGPQSLSQEFRQGVQRGTNEFQADLYGLAHIAGSMLGSQTLTDYALEGLAATQADAEHLAPTIAEFSDIHSSGDFFDYAAGALGSQIPNLVTMFGSGGIAGAVAKASLKTALRTGARAGARRALIGQFGKASRSELDRAVLKALDEPATQRLLQQAFTRGAGKGAGALSAGIQSGQLQNELTGAGIDAPLTALAGGAIAGALDAAPVAFLLDRVFPGVDRALSKAFVADIARTTGMEALLEGGTEGVQELVMLASRAMHDPALDITSPASRKQVLNAAAAGALVGAVMGGAGEAASFGPRATRATAKRAGLGAGKATDFLRSRVDLARGAAQVDTGELDAAVSGINEMRQAVSSFLVEEVGPVLSSAHEKLRTGAQAAKDALGVADLGIDLAGIASSLDEKVRTKVAPAISEVLTATHRQISNIRDQAAQVAQSDRAKFLQDGLEKIKQDVRNFIDQRLKPTIASTENDVAQEISTSNYDDEDSVADDEDPSDALDPEDLTRVVLGQSQKRTRSRGGVAVSSTVRSRDSDAVAFTSRSSAEQATKEVRESFPNLSEDAIDVEQRGDGYIVAIRDIGRAEEIFTQLRFVDGLTDARESARANPDETRRIEVKRPGATGYTRMDLPTLVLAGQDMIEREGTKLPENHNKAALRGLDTVLARMLDQGYEFKRGVGELRGKVLFPGQTVGNARRAAQFAPELDPAAREEQLQIEAEVAERPAADTPVFDAGGKVEPDRTLGKQENVTNTESLDNEATKRAASLKKKRQNGTPKQVRVGLSSVSEKTAQDVSDLVTELLRITGIKNRVLVVDQGGAQALINAKHPLSDVLARYAFDGTKGFITTLGDDAVIFLNNRVTVDKKNGSEEAARVETLRVLAHEFGHLVEHVYFRQIKDQALKDALWASYQRSGHARSFEEWMADQFVGYVARSTEPKDAVGKFFYGVAQVIKKMFDYLKGKYSVSGSYKDFAEGIAAHVRGTPGGNLYAQHFQNEGVVGRVWFKSPGEVAQHSEGAIREAERTKKLTGLTPDQLEEARMAESNADYNAVLTGPDEVNFFEPEVEALRASLKAKVNAVLDKYPGVKQAATRTWDMTMWIHDQLISSLNGQLRRSGIGAMAELADIFNRTPGKERSNPTYFNNGQLHQSLFAKQFNQTLQKMSEAEKAATIKDLIAGQRVEGISNVFKQLHAYMIDAGMPVKKVENYFPRVWDTEAVRENFAKIEAKLIELGLSQPVASRVASKMADTFVELEEDPEDTLDIPFGGFIQKRAKILDDTFFDQFQSRDLDRTIERYMTGVIKRAEFNRVLGSDVRKTKGKWQPREKFDALAAKAMKQGATQAQVTQMKDAVDAMLGRHGREIPVGARQAMAWVATYQNLRLCLFATLSSFPDIIGPAIRSNDFKGAFKSLRDNWRELTDKTSDINEMGRTWGIISDSLNQHVLTEHFDNHWFPERARRLNEKFFRAIGLERWTNFVRSAALAVGRDFIKRSAANGEADALGQLGLSVSDVQSWMDKGEPTFGSTGFDPNDTASRKVADALVQFVNESVMRPNASQRPLWASNPAFLLLFHLKSFMYAFHDTIARQVYQNFVKAGTPWQKALVVAGPALMMLALTAAGLELRELLQYKLWGKKAPSDSQGATDYVFNLAQRAGIFGPSQLAIDWDSADHRGQLPVMALAGPTVQQISDVLSKPASQTVPKAIPIVSQLPPVRAAIRDITPL